MDLILSHRKRETFPNPWRFASRTTSRTGRYGAGGNDANRERRWQLVAASAKLICQGSLGLTETDPGQLRKLQKLQHCSNLRFHELYSVPQAERNLPEPPAARAVRVQAVIMQTGNCFARVLRQNTTCMLLFTFEHSAVLHLSLSPFERSDHLWRGDECLQPKGEMDGW